MCCPNRCPWHQCRLRSPPRSRVSVEAEKRATWRAFSLRRAHSGRRRWRPLNVLRKSAVPRPQTCSGGALAPHRMLVIARTRWRTGHPRHRTRQAHADRTYKVSLRGGVRRFAITRLWGQIPVNREICWVFRVSGRLFRGGDAWRARQDAEIRSSIDEKSCVGAGSEQGSNRKRARKVTGNTIARSSAYGRPQSVCSVDGALES